MMRGRIYIEFVWERIRYMVRGIEIEDRRFGKRRRRGMFNFEGVSETIQLPCS